uniref:Uncharacterized protein n=1 Tax=Pristionchus pacificus TaxID=54126 RepID=A0A2A6C2X3_PRIPA|eukprot:PDM72582.1 hypothetical protein PRIPAC_39016 [Pristionchus pacificus]
MDGMTTSPIVTESPTEYLPQEIKDQSRRSKINGHLQSSSQSPRAPPGWIMLSNKFAQPISLPTVPSLTSAPFPTPAISSTRFVVRTICSG